MPSNVTGKSSVSSSSSKGNANSAGKGAPEAPPGASQAAWPALIPLGHHAGKPPIPLMRPVTLVGSRQNAHLHLQSRQISKAHALLISSDGKVYVRDLASRTHVYVNGQDVRETDLVDGDMLKIGSFVFKYQAAAGMKQKPRPDETPAGQLDVEGAEFPLQIDGRVMLIGRRPSCDISLMEESASTAHAVLFSMNGKRYVRDLGSRTGTHVNAQQVRQAEINFGDTIRIGDTTMIYQASALETPAAEVDELEDLVGTAPLTDVAARSSSRRQVPQEEPLAVEEAEPMLAAPTPVTKEHESLHATENDLPIPFDLDGDLDEKKAGDTAFIPLVSEPAKASHQEIEEPAPIPVEESAPELEPLPEPVAEDEALLPIEPEVHVSSSAASEGVTEAHFGETLELGDELTSSVSQPVDEAPIAPVESERILSEEELEREFLPELPPVNTPGVTKVDVWPAEFDREDVGPTEQPKEIARVEAPEAIDSEFEIAEPLEIAELPPLESDLGTEGGEGEGAAEISDDSGERLGRASEAAVPGPVEEEQWESELLPVEPTLAPGEAIAGGAAEVGKESWAEQELPELAEDAADADEAEAPRKRGWFGFGKRREEAAAAAEAEAHEEAAAEQPVESVEDVVEAAIAETPMAHVEDGNGALPLEELPLPDFDDEITGQTATHQPVNELAVEAAGEDHFDEKEQHGGDWKVGPEATEELSSPNAAEHDAPEAPSSETHAHGGSAADKLIEQELPEAVWETVEETVEKKTGPTEELAGVEAGGGEASEAVFFGDEPVDAIVDSNGGKDPSELELEMPPALAEPEAVAYAHDLGEPEASATSVSPLEVQDDEQYITGNVVDDFQVIEPTEPTNESALPLAEEEPALAEARQPIEGRENELTDSSFGKQVAEFTAESPEPVVEAPALEHVDDLVSEYSDEATSTTSKEWEPLDLATDLNDEPAAPASEPFMAEEAPPLVGALPIQTEPEPIAAPRAIKESPELLPEFDDAEIEQEVAAAAAERAAERAAPPEPAMPMRIPGMPLFDSGVTTSQFVTGLPLRLRELPAPPPTFGRVQVSFGEGLAGPVAASDLYEPGPFDRVRLDDDIAENTINGPAPVDELPSDEQLEEPLESYFNDEIADDPIVQATDAGELTDETLEPFELPAEEVDEAPAEQGEPPTFDEVVAEEPAHEAISEAVEEPIAEEPVAEEPVAAADEPAPAKPSFQNKLRVPPPPRRAARPAAQAATDEFGTPPAAPDGFGNAAQVFGGLSAPAQDVDVFSQGLSADLSSDPFFGTAVGKSHANVPAGDAGGKSKRRPAREPRKMKSGAGVDADVEALAGRLADDLGAPADAPPRVPPTQDRSRGPSNGENLPARQAGRAVQRAPGVARGAPATAIVGSDRSQSAGRVPAVSRPPVVEAPPPRSRGRLIGTLLVVMVLMMIAAFAIIYSIMKQSFQQQGSVTFENFNKLQVDARHRLQDSQHALFVSEKLRTVALSGFQKDHPNAPAGFLGDAEEFAKNETRVKWNGGTLVYKYVGTDRVLDPDRVKAVLEALVTLDAEMIGAAGTNRQQILNLRASLDAKVRELDDLKQQQKAAEQAMGRAPAADQIKAINSEKIAAEKAWKDAVAARHDAEPELQQLEEAGSAGLAASAATTTVTPSASGDPELDELQKNLEQWSNRLTTARSAAAEQAENARKALDTALEQFQQSTSIVQRTLKDNPELSAFLANTQKLQETAQKLSGDLLDRQQKTYERRLEEKRYLDERLAARRKELWDADVEMKRMKDDLGMLERQQSAAAGSGLNKEALEMTKQLDARLAKIEQRKMELDHDPIVATLDEFARKRQEEIVDARKQLEADRKQAEAFAKELEKNFAQLAPSVEKLPDAQRQMAQQMTAKMDAVSNARKAFAEALESQGSDANAGLKLMEDNVRLIAAKVDDRKKMLASFNSQQMPAEERQQRKVSLDKKRAAYAALKEREKQAYDLYFTKEKAAQLASEQVAAAEKARHEYDRLATPIATLEGGDGAEIPTLKRQLEQKEQLAGGEAYPSTPKMSEAVELADRRPIIAMGTAAGIALVFSLLVVVTSSRGSGSRDPYAIPFAAQAGEVEPLTGIGLRHPEMAELLGDHDGNGEAASRNRNESAIA